MQVLATNLLLWHVRWATEARDGLSAQAAAWLYALAARLQRPLTQDVMAALRALLRHCAQLRCGSPYAAGGCKLVKHHCAQFLSLGQEYGMATVF